MVSMKHLEVFIYISLASSHACDGLHLLLRKEDPPTPKMSDLIPWV